MEQNKKRIQILLSTYNGEKYLREQLDSFISLSNFEDCKVLVRDDGSTDSTLKILGEYRDKYGFEIISGDNVGLNRSMQELIRLRDKNCPYFAFSDQDDVWLPDKLERALSLLELQDNAIPFLYSSASYLTDESLNVKGTTLIAKKKLSYYNAMIQNVCPGHTQVCNNALAKELEDVYSSDMMVYDYWVYLVATALGDAHFDKKPSTLYRQHATNAIGCEHSRLKILKVRFGRVKSRVSAKNALQLKKVFELCQDKMKEEYKNETVRFFKSQKNFFSRLGYIFSSRAYRQTGVETLIFKFMYLLARYNV